MPQTKILIENRSWNKNSKTPRDYSKEYNPPGSKEQEERNKRKRDKRKHDKIHGECPEGTELHHTNGIEGDEVECTPVSKNRGRKEKSRKKEGEIIIHIRRKNLDVKKITEAPSTEPTVGDFLSTWQKQNPKSVQKILGKATKYILSLGTGLAAGAIAGPAGAAVGAGAGALAGKLSGEALNQLFGLLASKSGELAKFMVAMSDRQVPDDQRTGIDLYYDVDDEYEALLQGMDSKLANEYQKELFKYFKNSFLQMARAEPSDSLKDYIGMTANVYLQNYLADKTKSKVGVQVSK